MEVNDIGTQVLVNKTVLMNFRHRIRPEGRFHILPHFLDIEFAVALR